MLRGSGKRALRETSKLEMVAERCVLALLALCCAADGGAWMNSKATYLAGQEKTYYEMDVKATYLMIQNNDPNDAEQEELKQKTWSNQCMRNGWKESSYKEQDEKKVTDNNSYVRNERSWYYNVEYVKSI